MDLKFRRANQDDLDNVYKMFSAAVLEMEKNNIFQWDKLYPDRQILCEDIEKSQLYIGEMFGKTVCAYVINNESDKEYAEGKWEYPQCRYMVIHRLCVNPEFQNRGIGSLIMKHIENGARSRGIETIRLDAFTKNPFAVRMYEKLNYHKVGTVNWRMGRFYLMEKKL